MGSFKIDLIAGARPNFIKIAPIIDAIKAEQSNIEIEYRLIHTGQHYDRNMSADFFEQLEIPMPDINLNAGSGSHSQQTAKIMLGYEKILFDEITDYCLVVGDVTSTMACALVAKKMHVKVIHVEGGIRSFDLNMPEEINRIVTDSITDYFFTTSITANENLKKSGISSDRIFFVGNTMIDTLLKYRSKFIKPKIWDDIALRKEEYIVLTLHRPSNVDQEAVLKRIIDEIVKNSRGLPIIFPVHPRTLRQIKTLKIEHKNIYLVKPLSYFEFNYLVEKSIAVITDSGGITEETTIMNVPCMTLRDNTERPETVSIGTNELLGTNPDAISAALEKVFSKKWKKGGVPHLWDGKTSKRIIKNIIKVNNSLLLTLFLYFPL